MTLIKRFNQWMAAQPATNEDFGVGYAGVSAPSAPTADANQTKLAVEDPWADPHARWVEAAKDAEIEVLAKAEERMAAHRADHRKDAATFKFDCRRHGDFLAVFMTRLGYRYQNWTPLPLAPIDSSATINLGVTRNIVLIKGHAPDVKGRVSYLLKWMNDKGEQSVGNRQSHERFYKPLSGYRLTAVVDGRHDLPIRGPFSNPVMDTSPPTTDSVSYINYSGAREQPAGYTTENYPRSAEDDAIDFVGANIRLSIPAGKGQQVYASIMAALETKSVASVARLKVKPKGKIK